MVTERQYIIITEAGNGTPIDSLAKKAILEERQMALYDHARRRDLHHVRQRSRLSIDDMMRSTDFTLHIAIIALLIALAFGFWYF